MSLLFLDVSPEMRAAPKPYQRHIFVQWLVGVNTSTQMAKKREKDTKCSAIDSGLHHSLQGPCDHRREGRGTGEPDGAGQEQTRQESSSGVSSMLSGQAQVCPLLFLVTPFLGLC